MARDLDPRAARPSEGWRWAGLLGVAVGSGLATWMGAWLTLAAGGVPVLDPAAALLVAVLLSSSRPPWPGMLAAAVMGALAGGLGAGDSQSALAAALGLAGLLAVAARAGPPARRRIELARLRDLQRFGLLAVVAGPLVGALAWAATLSLAGNPPTAAAVARHGLASGVAVAVFTPAVLLCLAPWPGPPRWRAVATQGLLAGATALVFLQNQLPLTYLVLPPLLLAVGRQRLPGAACGLVIVALIAVGCTIGGVGRFALLQSGSGGRMLLLQVFLLVLAATALPLAAVLAGRARLDAVLRTSRARSRQRQALLTGVLEAMEQGLVAFDADGRLIAANRRFPDMIGVPRPLVAPGRHYREIAAFQAARGQFGPGDSEALAEARYEFATGHGDTRQIDGREIEIHRQPLPGGGFVSTLTDATERLRQTARLIESEASFRLLAEHSGDVILRTGLDGVRHYVSPSVKRVLFWSPEELVGRPMQEFVHPEDLAWVESSFATMRAGECEEMTVSYRLLRPDDSHAWVESRVRLLRDADTGAPAELIVAMRDATDRKAAEAELLSAFEQMENAALSDGLTGLANRRRFDETFAREWRRALREEGSLAVLLVDADRFKAFNDQYGHAAGDECLRRIAAVLADSSRRAGDLAARYGGEEFVLLLPGTDNEGAVEVAERIRCGVMDAALPHAGNPPSRVVTVSVGVVTLPPGLHRLPGMDALLRDADAALYAAKAAGRNRVMAASATIAAAAA